MFQKDHLFEWNTVLENVELGLKIKKKVTNYIVSLKMRLY